LVLEAQGTLEIECLPVVCIEKTKFDSAGIFCFKPMNHGRHGAAGASGEAEEFDELDSTRREADRRRVGGFEIRSARGGDGERGRREGLGGRG